MAQGEHEKQQQTSMVSSRELELRLILDEERAERRVARARARLERAYKRLERAERRVDRRTRQLQDAEAGLLACQQRRAQGSSGMPAEPPAAERAAANEEPINPST